MMKPSLLSCLFVVTLAVSACSGKDEPAVPEQAGTPAAKAAPDPATAVTRTPNKADLDTVVAGLSGPEREAVLALVDAARDKRLEAAQWLGEAIDIEKQAREYEAVGDTERARTAWVQAADKRKLAKQKLAEARADESRARTQASGDDDQPEAPGAVEE